jgi:hypothetical protein
MIKMMEEGDLNVIYPEKLGIWNTLLRVKQMLLGFLTTEGIEASSKNIELDKFTLDEFNILWLFTYIDKRKI